MMNSIDETSLATKKFQMRSMSALLKRMSGILMVCFSFFFSVHLAKADTLQKSMSKTAYRIESVLKELGSNNSIGIASFNNKNRRKDASYGNRIRESLRRELVQRNVQVMPETKYAIRGTYAETVDLVGVEVISVHFELIDEKDRMVDSFRGNSIEIETAKIYDEAEFNFVKMSAVASHARVPALSLDKGEFLSLQDIGFSMRLIEGRIDVKGQKRMPTFISERIIPVLSPDTDPYYRLSQDKLYQLEIRNSSDEPIDFAVQALFDGIDSFALGDNSMWQEDPVTGVRVPKYKYWKVANASSSIIPGWFKNLDTVSAFQAKPDKESVAYKLGQGGKIQTIQLLVRAAWPETARDRIPPRFKLPLSKTAFAEGPSLNVKLKAETLEIGAILGCLTVKYE